MISSDKKPGLFSLAVLGPLLGYFIVLIVGLLIVLMLVLEHQQAKSVMNENQVLMRDVVVKTLHSNIADSISTYPLDKSSIEQNWLSLNPNFELLYDNKPIYPFRFNGPQSNSPSPLWALYQTALNIDIVDPGTANLETVAALDVASLNEAAPDTRARIRALQAIKTALGKPQPAQAEQLRDAIDAYFTQVQYFQLSSLEEIVSGLSFLQIDPTSRWNDLLIKQVLQQDTLQARPLFAYLFQQSEGLPSADALKAIETMRTILSPTTLDTSWFTQNVDAYWQTSIATEHAKLAAYSMLNKQWLVVKPSERVSLILPFNLPAELSQTQQQLIAQGLLDRNDKIVLLTNIDAPGEILLSGLDIQVTRLHWERQLQRQTLYFVMKIVATMLLILSLLLLTKWFVTRQRKKLEYIELRENFINLVSHELKTPLASIRIMVETLQKRNERELSIKDYPQKIVAEVDHLWFMVDNLLSLNHIKSNELSLNIESQNLHSAIERVKLKLIENAAGKLTIVNNVPMHVRLPVDALLFDLVLINIVSNAIKYCDKAAPIVELSFEPDKQRLLVRDNACGVAHENWQRVFNDFYREDNKLSRQGTGIGLSLCHQIMQLHHGAIYIEESSAEGTLWCVELPLKFVEELRN